MKKIVTLIFLLSSLQAIALDNYSFRINSSLYQGTTNEIVYRYSGSDDKLSELIWEDEIRMIGLGVTYEFGPELRINGDLYLSAGSEGEGEMDDYDWKDYSISDWTNWSHHKTKSSAAMLDINAEMITFPTVFGDVFFTAGLKYDYVSSKDYEADLVYSSAYYSSSVKTGDSSASGFRDDISSYSGRGVTYKRSLQAPYIGVGLVKSNEYYSISGKVLYSEAVTATDEDTHHLRDLFFEEDFEDGKMISVVANGKYYLSESFLVFARAEYTEYFLIRGSIRESKLSTGKVTGYSEDSAGIEHQYITGSIGVEFKI